MPWQPSKHVNAPHITYSPNAVYYDILVVLNTSGWGGRLGGFHIRRRAFRYGGLKACLLEGLTRKEAYARLQLKTFSV